jgi:hypothetical protein
MPLLFYSKKAKQSRNTPMEAQRKRMYSSYSFMTSALHGGVWSASRPGRALAPGYPFDRRLGGPQSRSGRRGYRKNPFATAGDGTSIARSSSQ